MSNDFGQPVMTDALSKQILNASQDWLAQHLKHFGADGSAISDVLEGFIALALDDTQDRPTRERAVRAACRVAEVNQLRLADERRFLEAFDEDLD